MERSEFDSRVDKYIRKFGGASRFIQKIINSFDCLFAIVDVNSFEVELTNAEDFFHGMKCRDLFKCFGDKECPIKKVVERREALVVNNGDFGSSLEIHIHPIFNSSGDVVSVIVYRLDIVQSQALIESEEKFKEAFQHSTSVMSISTIEDNRFLEVNEKFLEVLGYVREEVIGKTSLDLKLFVYERDMAYVIDEMQKKGSIKNYELKVLNKKGGVVTGLFSAETIKLLGKPYYLTVFEDITERKNAEKEIENLARFPHENKSPVIRISDKGILLYANPATLFLLKDWKWKIGKSAPEQLMALVGINSELVEHVEEISYNDKIFVFDVIHVSDSNYINLYGRDVTNRRRVEMTLREKEEMRVKDVEERFYNILQNSQDLVYRYNFRTNSFDYVSESVFTILGYSLGEFMKMTMSDYNGRIHPDDVGIVSSVEDSSEDESTSVVEYRFKKKDGDYIWLKVQRVFFRDKNGELIYSIEDVKDITTEKLAEEERVKLEERIVHMKNRQIESRERVSLTGKEKLVLWGFCRYPLLNDGGLASKLDLKRSTLTAIKNRLKGKGWFNLNYIPNFRKLDCQFFSIFDVNLKKGKAKSLEFLKKTSEIVLSNYQDDKFLGVFVSDKYVDFKRFLDNIVGFDILKYGFNEDSFFYDLDNIELYDISKLLNSLFILNRKEKSAVYKFENGEAELNVNEKRVLHAMVKDPEMSSADIAKKIWTSKPTVIKVKKKLLEEGYVYLYVVPDFRKMGFPYIARLSFSFDSDLSVVNNKGSKDARVVLQISGKKKMTRIMLFGSEDEYEDEIDLIKESYRKKGIDFKLNSEIFPIQKRRINNSRMESFVGDKLFGDEI